MEFPFLALAFACRVCHTAMLHCPVLPLFVTEIASGWFAQALFWPLFPSAPSHPHRLRPYHHLRTCEIKICISYLQENIDIDLSRNNAILIFRGQTGYLCMTPDDRLCMR